MIARGLLGEATATLASAGVPSPELDARLLLAHVLGVPHLTIDTGADLATEQTDAFGDLLARRARREPLQYLLGTAAFRYVELEVGPGVFVPRPETELLAGWAIAQIAARHAAGVERPIAVDLCTGSGAIAKALVDEQPQAEVFAVELAEEALSYARRNLAGSGVDLRAGDIADCLPELDGRVDVVVANPPYIPLGEYESVDVEAREHDPAIALWSGADGLDTVRSVERVAHRLLRPDGVVACEHADLQGESVPRIFGARWTNVRDHRDLADRPRFTTAQRPDA
ncbi:MAG TPA: peptide chain release factor N(5)-glutamine methyltransferase [Nocardioidaceae bacterium]|nr:peptide chain release factor N(5)-glutamine methyltransferase [Nocardioidaceae bacterium]